MPKATALLRCHDNEATVERALRSLVAQELGERLEIVAVDDGSKDGSWKRIEAFAPRVKTLRLSPNRGNVGAAYAALEKATGDYFFLLDADDWAEPSMASRLAAALDAAPDAAFAWCDYVEEDEKGSRRVRVEAKVGEMIACNAMFRRDAVLRAGFWDKAFLLPEYDLAVRLLSRAPATFVDFAPYHYCRHGASMTRQNDFFERAMRQLDDRFGALAPSGRFRDLTVADCRAAATAGSASKEN